MPDHNLVGIRGATTASSNTPEAIGAAVGEMVETLMQRNGLMPD